MPRVGEKQEISQHQSLPIIAGNQNDLIGAQGVAALLLLPF